MVRRSTCGPYSAPLSSRAEGSSDAMIAPQTQTDGTYRNVTHGREDSMRRRAAGFAALSRPHSVAWNLGTRIPSFYWLDKAATGDANLSLDINDSRSLRFSRLSNSCPVYLIHPCLNSSLIPANEHDEIQHSTNKSADF